MISTPIYYIVSDILGKCNSQQIEKYVYESAEIWLSYDSANCGNWG